MITVMIMIMIMTLKTFKAFGKKSTMPLSLAPQLVMIDDVVAEEILFEGNHIYPVSWVQ